MPREQAWNESKVIRTFVVGILFCGLGNIKEAILW